MCFLFYVFFWRVILEDVENLHIMVHEKGLISGLFCVCFSFICLDKTTYSKQHLIWFVF
jgi:hypothetical protein